MKKNCNWCGNMVKDKMVKVRHWTKGKFNPPEAALLFEAYMHRSCFEIMARGDHLFNQDSKII